MEIQEGQEGWEPPMAQQDMKRKGLMKNTGELTTFDNSNYAQMGTVQMHGTSKIMDSSPHLHHGIKHALGPSTPV